MATKEFKHAVVAAAIDQLIKAFQEQLDGEIISIKSITFELAGGKTVKSVGKPATLGLMTALDDEGPGPDTNTVCTSLGGGLWSCV